VYEYNAPLYRERQWAFRRGVDMDANVKRFGREVQRLRDEKDMQHTMIEIETGHFPNGGRLLARYYVDERGRACEKAKATACVEREMDGNAVLKQERKTLKKTDN
jgi:hypothetical protein